MTSAASQQFYDTFPPEVARAFLEGRRLRVHVVKVYLVRTAAATVFAIDGQLHVGGPEAWAQIGPKIYQILEDEIARLPAKTTTRLVVNARAVLPEGAAVLLIALDTWLSMKDGGGSRWEVRALPDPDAARCLPDVGKAAERAKKRVLRVVTQI